jgi:hypothetical protein
LSFVGDSHDKDGIQYFQLFGWFIMNCFDSAEG